MPSTSNPYITFTKTAKHQIKLLSQNQCWACTGTSPDISLVVDWDYQNLNHLTQRGLLNYNPYSPDNGIALCGTCKANFIPNNNDPGWIFTPSDLEYFIEYEEKDYHSRTQAAKHDILAPRTCPSTNDYRAHQTSQSIINENEVGGLYRQIWRRDFQPMICESVVEELVVWHGAPMAAVTRAFGVFGLESERVPGDVLDGLRRLKELYARPAPGFRRIGVYRGWDRWMVDGVC